MRLLLMAALGPPAGRPSVVELRTGLEQAVANLLEPSVDPQRRGIARLFAELHRRRVTRTAFWYVGGSVALVEAANLFVPMLGGDVAIVRLLAILAVCGLPIALTLSWVFDIAPAAHSGLIRWPRFTLLAGVVLVSLFGATVIWRSGAQADVADDAGAAAAQAVDPAHIAVLGFNTIGGDEELAAFAAQLQVRLIDGLSAAAMGTSATQERTLRVLSRAGVLPFSGGGFAVDSLREARRVGTVLEGTVEQTAGAVRVRVRLVDTQTGYQIHTSSADHPVDDRVALLDAVADSVIRLVRKRLGPVVREHMRLLETRSQPAFDRLLWAQRRLEEFERAFQRSDYAAAEHVLNDADSVLAAAELLDPQWIEPIVMRGRQAKRRVLLSLGRGDSSAVVPEIMKGIAHAERALVLDPSNARALELRGGLRQYQLQSARPAQEAEAYRLRADAEHDLRASLIGHHAPAGPLRMLSELAAGDGRMEEALSYGERAFEQDPFMEQVQWTVFRLFEYSFALGQDSAAARWCLTGGQRFPEIPVFHDCRLALAAWSDAFPLSADSAWAALAAELSAYPLPLRPNLEPRLHAMMAAILARQAVRDGVPATRDGSPSAVRRESERAALRDSARSLLREARRRDASPGVLRAAAGVHGLLGEADSALAVLGTLLQRAPTERRALQSAIELRTVLRDPRARALIEARPAAVGRPD
ncbi:hypothetical protein BH23GEM9_BH23GEM9_07630 [soil metagenome]